VLLVYIGLLAAGVRWIDPQVQRVEFAGYMVLISAGFVWICWRKGERPRWRWGGD
jgi:hypothetical protein